MFSKDSLQMIVFVGGLFIVILGLHFYLNDGFGPAFSPKFFERNDDIKKGIQSLGSTITEGGKTIVNEVNETKQKIEKDLILEQKTYENDLFVLTYPATWGITEYERVVALNDGVSEISLTYFDDEKFFNEIETRIKDTITPFFSAPSASIQSLPDSIITIGDLVGVVEKKTGSVSLLFPIDDKVIIATTRGAEINKTFLSILSGIDFKGDRKESDSCLLSSKALWKSSDGSVSVEHIPLSSDLLVVKKPNNAVFLMNIYDKVVNRVWNNEKNFVGEIYLPYNTDTHEQTVKISIFGGGVNSRIVHECIRSLVR